MENATLPEVCLQWERDLMLPIGMELDEVKDDKFILFSDIFLPDRLLLILFEDFVISHFSNHK